MRERQELLLYDCCVKASIERHNRIVEFYFGLGRSLSHRVRSSSKARDSRTTIEQRRLINDDGRRVIEFRNPGVRS